MGQSTPHCHNDPCGNKGNTACDGDNLVSIGIVPVWGFYPAGVSGVVRECFQQGSGVAAGSCVDLFHVVSVSGFTGVLGAGGGYPPTTTGKGHRGSYTGVVGAGMLFPVHPHGVFLLGIGRVIDCPPFQIPVFWVDLTNVVQSHISMR